VLARNIGRQRSPRTRRATRWQIQTTAAAAMKVGRRSANRLVPNSA
jgi:hypothetical protein